MQKLPMRNKSRSCCAKCFLGTVLYIFILLLLLFLIIFVVVPVVFKYSTGIQQNLIFPTWIIQAENYTNVEAFGIKGVKNFYLNLENEDNVTLGIWHILPFEILSDVIDNNDYNYDGILENANYNILLYLHGNGGDRTSSLELYEILRRYFQIFAVDYRGYADSSKAKMGESGIVADIVQLYKWLRTKSKSKIFFWGHSLGTGVASHAIANLKRDNISSHGVVLEAPFTSVTDVMKTHPVVKVFSFLPWFSITIIDPIIGNDLNFNVKAYILDVDCPVMILHAKDDDIISYNFATEVYNTAVNSRNYTYQGNVTYHLFDVLNYGHMYLYKAPELSSYVGDFIAECDNFERQIHN
ncbi:monoacylglycerol lipase ABHD12-like [Anoplophora glabripennis]|uniref:monoacylglycerol lipase ABHD12-like n=1 Tax=Anoplophora glabripennis TaxID=217634 RepID=UPI000873791B|nr:monoacylglycerol lipase ABHD12-like [Anoplophora glabripennis]